MPYTEYVQVSTTVAKKNDAEKIARMLSDKKLSACTQIVGPIISVYRWRGKVTKSKEWLCVAKSKRSLYKKIEQTIKDIHPYALPEIITTPIVYGNSSYLDWIKKEVE